EALAAADLRVDSPRKVAVLGAPDRAGFDTPARRAEPIPDSSPPLAAVAEQMVGPRRQSAPRLPWRIDFSGPGRVRSFAITGVLLLLVAIGVAWPRSHRQAVS